MTARHILFIPWQDNGEADEQKAKCLNWRDSYANGETHHSATFEVVTYNDGTDLSNLPWYSEIYVRGHGGKGKHTISNANPVTSRLKYDEVADRLISHGLKKTWSGAIKLWNCHSGECTLGMQSFAAKFAQHMRFKKNYHLISYVGYRGALDSYPSDEAGHKYKHKYSTSPLTGKEVKSKWMKVLF